MVYFCCTSPQHKLDTIFFLDVYLKHDSNSTLCSMVYFVATWTFTTAHFGKDVPKML